MKNEQLVMWGILGESSGAARQAQEDPQDFTLEPAAFQLLPVSLNPRGAEAIERRAARLREIEAAKELRRHA